MARPRQFDRDEALQKATDVFWTHGYEATSMTDLQKALGIGRQSLYSTFGDKPRIFDEVVQRYVSEARAMIAERVGPDAGIAELRAHLLGAAGGLAGPEERRGCLIMNSCVERAPHDPGIAELLRGGLDAMRGAFGQALTNAKQRGEIRADIDVEAAASSLLAQNAGMAVLARTGATAEDLASAVNVAIDALLL